MKKMLGLWVLAWVALPAGAQVEEYSILINNEQEQEAGNCLEGSTSVGLGEAFFDPASGELDWAVLFGNNPPAFDDGVLVQGSEIAAHIHNAPRGVNGPVEIDLGVGASKNGSAVLTTAQIEALRAGDLYVNIHSLGCPAGEIRGQVNRVVMPTAAPTVVPTPDPKPSKKAKKAKKSKSKKAKKSKGKKSKSKKSKKSDKTDKTDKKAKKSKKQKK